MGWRENITGGSEFLAALAILASGVTFVVDKFWLSKQVDVSASFVTSGTKNLSLLMSNDGQIDVAIKKITIEVPGYGFSNPVELELGGELLPKNSSKLLKSNPSFLNSTVIADEINDSPNLSIIDTTDCTIKIIYIAARDDNPKEIPLKLKCYAISVADQSNLSRNK
ncbi:hypothetical protein MI048_07515 [Pantoea agglomerans]|uniref:hypothetical protein n=1 Tax=Enterobacter agglomerans TaxID=549 RepID=UPI00311FE720